MSVHEIWFWQLIVSPHMAGLGRALAECGHKVIYVAQQQMTPQRAAQGWQPPSLGKAILQLAPTQADALALAEQAPPGAVHICQGIRGNAQIGPVQQRLAQLGRNQWVVMETVDDAGWRGIAKRLAYRYLFARLGPMLQGVLATGRSTPQWVIDRGMPSSKVYPFAYFLPEPEGVLSHSPPEATQDDVFKVLFVGQFIELKRLDLLIDALAVLGSAQFELLVVGSGPLEARLREQAEQVLGNRVNWIGRLPMADVQQLMAEVDCLVLPSRHDGWGAVVVEALMAGTPAICSDCCGAAEAVLASGVGGVFVSGDKQSLMKRLAGVIDTGIRNSSQRKALANWATTSFSAQAGAKYLAKVLTYSNGAVDRPAAPWLSGLPYYALNTEMLSPGLTKPTN